MSSKPEEPLPLKLLICWEYHLGQFRTFWNTIWSCVGLQSNFLHCTCVLCFVCALISKEKQMDLPCPPCSSVLVPYNVCLLVKLEVCVKLKEFQWYHHDSKKTAGCTCWVSNSLLQEMLTNCIKSCGDCFEGDNIDWKGSGSVMDWNYFSPEIAWLHCVYYTK